MSDLKALLERVRAAVGPDRELDDLLYDGLIGPKASPDDAWSDIPRYTGSVDDALEFFHQNFPATEAKYYGMTIWDSPKRPEVSIWFQEKFAEPELGENGTVLNDGWAIGTLTNGIGGIRAKTLPLAIIAGTLDGLIKLG